MSDQEGVRRPAESTPPPAPSPGHLACPRCRGTFEGDPDTCPHCGLTKAEIPKLNQAIATPAAPPPPPTAPPYVASAASAAPDVAIPAAEPAAPELTDSGGGTTSRRPRRLLAAVAAVLLLGAGGVGWWLTKGGGDTDPCANFPEELRQVEAREHANSRDERRAVADVVGRAHDAGCDLGAPAE